MTTKDIHVIVVGAEWYGDWAHDVYVALKNLNVSSEIVYTNSVAGLSGGETASIWKKLFQFGKDTLRKVSGSLFNRLKQARAKAAESEVINRVDTYSDKNKQIIALFIWTPLGADVLKKLQDRGVRCILWQGEPAANDERWQATFDYFEHMFIIDEGFKKNFPASILARSTVLPLATSEFVHYPLPEPASEFTSEVAFIGLYRQGRASILSSLKDFNLKIYGYGWQEGFSEFPWLKTSYQGPLTAEETNKVFNSATISIGRLALSFEPETGQTTNQRVFDISAAKGFQLTQYADSTPEFFGDTVVMFNSREELIDKVRYYLAHPEERRQLAEKAYSITIQEHTYTARVKEILKTINIVVE